MAIALSFAPAARAAISDSEPGNDDRLTTPSELVRSTSVVTGSGAFRLNDGESCSELLTCDVDFVRLVGLHAGDFVGVVTSSVLPDTQAPDVLVGLLDATGAVVAIDPDFSIAGSLGFRVDAAGDYTVAVSGTSDLEFGGEHLETGPYDLGIAIMPVPALGASFTDAEPSNNSPNLNTATSVTRGEGIEVFAASMSLRETALCLQGDGGCDRDYLRAREFVSGDRMTYVTFPLGAPGELEPVAPDTFAALFDTAGNLLADDPDTEVGSRIDFTVPEDGTYVIGVTGSFDDFFEGLHDQVGPYQAMLLVAPAPEPDRAAGVCAALVTLIYWRRLRRSGGARPRARSAP